MAYEVNVYVTQQLYDDHESQYGDGYRAQKRGVDYVIGALHDSPYAYYVKGPSPTPAAPTEEVNQSFTTMDPCSLGHSASYDALFQWFRDWLNCNGHPTAIHSNILITASDDDNGLSGPDNHTAAECGPSLAEAPSSRQREGCNSGFNAVQTLLHEVGHNLVENSSNYQEHDLANTFETNPWYVTPMGVSEPYNHCGSSVDKTGSRCFKTYWSDCSENRFK